VLTLSVLCLIAAAQVLQQPQYRGKALPGDHPDSKLIQKIAERIIAAVEEGHGGGFQKHVEKFDWEVVVINEETVNAFVLPGGKIVVFTGESAATCVHCGSANTE
jgi:predicted Zn-dependent protease